MDEYRVVRQLGKGATSIAYLVEHKLDKQLYVIKEIEMDSLDIASKKNVVQEVNIVQHLKHDNIIKIYNATINGTNLDILMEYSDKGDLEHFLKKKKGYLSEDEIMDLFVQICLAVKYIHDRKIIHRDLKTSNIFLCGNKIIKLGDFGFAKALESTIDQAKTQLGTPYYLSPEICTGKPYSTPSDIWALGCILFELCSKRKPFLGDDIGALIKKILTEKEPKIPSIYCKDIQDLFKMMLQKDPSKRPTINQILALPVLKYKAIALLGKKNAEIELNHSTFHGFGAGITPVEIEKEIEKIRILKPEDSEFYFMGKPLDLGKAKTEKEKILFVNSFIESIISPHRYGELRKFVANNTETMLPKSEEYIIDLIKQLIKFSKKYK